MNQTRSRRHRSQMQHDLSWISLLSTASVVGYLVVMQAIEPVGWARAHMHTRFILAIGYGHLLSSVIGVSTKSEVVTGTRRLAWSAALLLTYSAYTHICHAWPGLPLGLLGVSAWHTFENDRAIRRTPLTRRGGLEPISRSRRDHVRDFVGMSVSGAAVVALPRVLPWVHATDVIVAFTLQHLFSWLVFAIARGHARGELRATWLHLLRLHLPMIGLCIVASGLLAHASTMRASIVGESARLLLEPSTYLFWTTAHVAHTAWRRRPGATR